MAARSKAWVCCRSPAEFVGFESDTRFGGTYTKIGTIQSSGVPRNFVRGGGVQQIQLRTEDRENRGTGDGSPLVRGSGGSCNLLQEISIHVVKFS